MSPKGLRACLFYVSMLLNVRWIRSVKKSEMPCPIYILQMLLTYLSKEFGYILPYICMVGVSYHGTNTRGV